MTSPLRGRRVLALGMLPALAALLLSLLLLAATGAHAATAGCFGAAALADHCPETMQLPTVPMPDKAKHDLPHAYDKQRDGKDCWSHPNYFPNRSCVFGNPRGTFRVALVGNSHAGQWLPALQGIAASRGWKIVTFLASGCASADVRQDFGSTAADLACRHWAQRTRYRVLTGHFDLVVMSNRVSRSVPGKSLQASMPLYRAGYARVIGAFTRAHLPVAVLRDTPAPGDAGIASMPDCLTAHPDNFRPCSALRGHWLPQDPSVGAAYDVHSRLVTVSDLTNHICGPVRCWGAVGDVIVYRDGSHLTATYDRTLRPWLTPALRHTLQRARS